MPASVRITDSVSCGDTMAEGSANTFADHQPMSRELTDNTAGHCFQPTPVAVASPNVFVNNIPADRLGDPIVPHTCPPVTHGGYMVTGASNVFINSGGGAGALIDNNPTIVTTGILPPNTNPNHSPEISSAELYVYEKNDIPEENNPPPPMTDVFNTETEEEDTTPPPTDVLPVLDCAEVSDLDDDFSWATESGATTFSAFAASFVLSQNFTVLDLCYCAVSRYEFSSDVIQSSGLSQKAILLNMCYHAKTVLEPMLSQYGDYTITSGFRNKTGSSQHNKGQATDIQFLNIHGQQDTNVQYFELAKNIRDDVSFDQMILEWFGRNPWIHISSNHSGHRHSVLTQTSHNTYQNGLLLLAKT